MDGEEPVTPPDWAPAWATEGLTAVTFQKLAESRYGNELARELELLKAQLAESKTRLDTASHLQEASSATEEALQKAFHDSLLEVSKGTLARAQAAAEFVQKGAGAIVTLYTGVLALAFTAADSPLPLRGVLPALFLGLAVAFATGYVAYLNHPPATAAPAPSSLPREYQLNRTVTFIKWISNTAMHRALWMRRAVVSLAIGAVLLPLPFLQFPETQGVAVAETAWPEPPARIDDSTVELFKAQVAEAARLRQADEAARPSDDAGLVVLVGMLGIFLVLTLPLTGGGAKPAPVGPPAGPVIPPAIAEEDMEEGAEAGD